MKLSKVDLSSLIAIAHSEGYLQLLLDRGNELEFLEIPAPIQAYEGLQDLNEIIAPEALKAAEPIPMLPVSSSMAASIGYDKNEQILQVEFHNGAVYQYSGVEADTWSDLHDAESVGRYYNYEIKGKYECDRVDNTEYFDDCCD